MTGDELYKVYNVSGLTPEEFAVRVGVSRAKLYTQFKQKEVDLDVQLKIKGDPELTAKRTLIELNEKNSEQLPDQMPKYYPGQDMLAKTLEMINDTLTILKRDNDTLIENNKHIREEANFLRGIMQDGYNQGLLMWNPKAIKKT